MANPPGYPPGGGNGQGPYNPYAPQQPGQQPGQAQPGQPGQAQPGQPVYGQPAPPYGQPAPPYGQPQPQYGQPPYGQPQGPYGYSPPPAYLSGPSQVPVGNMPGSVKAAAILWIIYGGLSILGSLMSIAGRPGVSGLVGLIFGVGFLATGIQTLMGKVSSVLGAGITCLVLAALTLLVTVFFMGNLGAMGGVLAITLLIPLGLLGTAGVLAIIGNESYKQWKMARGY